MSIEEKRLAVVRPPGLVHAFAVQEPVIEDRDHGVLLVEQAAVDVDRRCHQLESTTGHARRSTGRVSALWTAWLVVSKRSDRLTTAAGFAQQRDTGDDVFVQHAHLGVRLFVQIVHRPAGLRVQLAHLAAKRLLPIRASRRGALLPIRASRRGARLPIRASRREALLPIRASRRGALLPIRRASRRGSASSSAAFARPSHRSAAARLLVPGLDLRPSGRKFSAHLLAELHNLRFQRRDTPGKLFEGFHLALQGIYTMSKRLRHFRLPVCSDDPLIGTSTVGRPVASCVPADDGSIVGHRVQLAGS